MQALGKKITNAYLIHGQAQATVVRGEMEAQAIAMCLNAYARSTVPENISIPALFLHLGGLARRRGMHEYRPQTIAMIFNAFSRYDVVDKKLFAYLSEVCGYICVCVCICIYICTHRHTYA
jgi:hypothetical protein